MRHFANVVEPMYPTKYEENHRLLDQIWHAVDQIRACNSNAKNGTDIQKMHASFIEEKLRYIEDLAYTIERRHTRKRSSRLLETGVPVSGEPVTRDDFCNGTVTDIGALIDEAVLRCED